MIEIIETYWNVNNNSTENFTAAQNEIIETYWNVNKSIPISNTDIRTK
mgnify:FL=1